MILGLELGTIFSIIEVILAGLASIFSFISARRAKMATSLVAQANASQDCRRCNTLSNHLIRLMPYGDNKLCIDLLNDLHDQLATLSIRHKSIFNESERAELEKSIETCRQIIYAYANSRDNINKNDLINGIRFVAKCMLELTTKHEKF